jgi:hypothetical protein
MDLNTKDDTAINMIPPNVQSFSERAHTWLEEAHAFPVKSGGIITRKFRPRLLSLEN